MKLTWLVAISVAMSCASGKAPATDGKVPLPASVNGIASSAPSIPVPEVSTGASSSSPTTFLSCDGQVSVTFPASPTNEPVVEKQLTVSASGLELKMHMVARSSGEADFSFAWADYPHEVVQQKSPSQFLKDVEERGIAERGTTLEADRELKIAGAPARLWTYSGAKIPGQRGCVLATLQGDRLIQVIVVATHAETIDAPVTHDFLDSVKFVRCKK
jgi:hypothetical protein